MLQVLEIVNFPFRQETVLATLQATKPDFGNGNTLQKLHFLAYALEHLFDLAVSAFRDGDFHTCVMLVLFQNGNLCRCGFFAVHNNAVFQLRFSAKVSAPEMRAT